jgi:zinc transporter ZupT
MHLLPDVYESKDSNIGIFIMMGILFQIILEFFLQRGRTWYVHGQNMSHIPWLLFISLCIHVFLEGFL